MPKQPDRIRARPNQRRGGAGPSPSGGRSRGRGGRGRGRQTGFPWTKVLIPGAAVLVVVIVLIIVVTSGGGGGTNSSAADYQPAASGVVAAITNIPQSVYDQVKLPSGAASPPKLGSSGPALTANGKPLMLYMGEEWCPYCGASRWPMVAALSRFGTWSGLKTALSSSSDVDPDTNTFSFVGATYTSQYLDFQAVEMQNSSRHNLETPTAAQTRLMSTYDPSGGVPFIDFANKYIVGSTYDPAVLQGLSWSQIASQLSDPGAKSTQNIVGSANFLSALICKLTNGTPASVCTSPGVTAADATLAAAK